MDRLGFFSYVKKSLVNTVKEMSVPFVEEDIKKVDRWIDDLAGIEWIPIQGKELDDAVGYKDLYIANKHFLSFFNGEDVRIYEKVCQKCHIIVHWLSYDESLKCFQCDTSFKVKERQGELQLKEYRAKCENGIWFIGIL
ncbi:hypothetical protein M670_03545 [Schinkia azotoformans MEV2011]|uniref:Uncharacterized protein n=1 Tax=Schinkia azotoformans MEV2011 TaxID=1348973 RepID=A0A072NK43_SCHAZ|nr:hypothetical protein [Schinkia azotoformans]KEF37298.1 hypothetical protein M670_03545 [Schinkia azotoformans MEV2011]